jgi:hypothetical protein
MLPEVNLLGLYEPFVWLRPFVGLGYNLIGMGFKGGVTVVSPVMMPLSFTAEGGRFFSANANATIRKLTDQNTDVAALRKVGYDYANLLLGIEAGSAGARFYLRAGATYLRASGHEFAETLSRAGVAVSRSSDPRISYRGPTIRLGLLWFFW